MTTAHCTPRPVWLNKRRQFIASHTRRDWWCFDPRFSEWRHQLKQKCKHLLFILNCTSSQHFGCINITDLNVSAYFRYINETEYNLYPWWFIVISFTSTVEPYISLQYIPFSHQLSNNPYRYSSSISFISSVELPVSLLSLRWHHNESDCVSNHQPHYCLLNCLFRCRSKKTSKLRVPGLCARNSPVTGEFPAQMASNAENVSIWWRHHGIFLRNDTKAIRFTCWSIGMVHVIHFCFRLSIPGCH